MDPNDLFRNQFMAALLAAARWGVVDVGPGRCAVLTNWRFEENRVAGDPGVIQIEDQPVPFSFVSCTFRNNSDFLELADTIVKLVNDETGRSADT